MIRRGMLTLAYLAIGPLVALSITAVMVGFDHGFGPMGPWPIVIVAWLGIFYVISAAPALVTGWLTETRIRRHGRCAALRSAAYGAAASAIILVGFVLIQQFHLYSFDDRAKHGGGLLQALTILTLFAGKGLLGFFATLPVWWLTRGLQNRISASVRKC